MYILMMGRSDPMSTALNDTIFEAAEYGNHEQEFF